MEYKFKGTQGKWIVDVDIIITDAPVVGNIVCEAPVAAHFDSYANWQANAKLIAASPELLEACLAFVELFRESDMRPEDECSELYDKINAAIQKATL